MAKSISDKAKVAIDLFAPSQKKQQFHGASDWFGKVFIHHQHYLQITNMCCGFNRDVDDGNYHNHYNVDLGDASLRLIVGPIFVIIIK